MAFKKTWGFTGLVVTMIFLGILLIVYTKNRNHRQEYQAPQSVQLKRDMQKKDSTFDTIKKENQSKASIKNPSPQTLSTGTHQQSTVSSFTQDSNTADHRSNEFSPRTGLDEQHPMHEIIKKGFSEFQKPRGLIEIMDNNKDGYISPDEFEGPAKTFAMLDADDDGLISADDLNNPRPFDEAAQYNTQTAGEDAAASSGDRVQSLMNWDFEKAFAAMDSDMDGTISSAEFKGSTIVFKKLDTNKDREISVDELKTLPQVLRPSQKTTAHP